MSELIETTLKTAAANGKNTLRHDISAELRSDVVVNECLQAWGSALGVSRAAPSWQRVSPFIDDFKASSGALSLALDQDGAGALSLSYSADQRRALTELLDELKALASEAQAPQASIDKAQTAFEAKASSFELSEEFGAGMAPLAVSSFLEKSAAFVSDLEHSEFGSLEARDLHALAKVNAAKPQAELEAEAQAAEAAAASGQAQAPAGKRYASLGQIVKANDGPALEKIIKDSQEMGVWEEDKVEAATKLLWHAAQMGHVDVARVLMDIGGATMDHLDNNGMSPMLCAASADKPDMVDFLLSRGAELTETTIDGKTPLMLAAECDAIASIARLLDLGVDIDEKALDGRTASHFAALGSNDETAVKAVALLIERGANPTLPDELSGGLPEEYISEGDANDEVYANLTAYRKAWENGEVKPKANSVISKARSVLGF